MSREALAYGFPPFPAEYPEDVPPEHRFWTWAKDGTGDGWITYQEAQRMDCARFGVEVPEWLARSRK